MLTQILNRLLTRLRAMGRLLREQYRMPCALSETLVANVMHEDLLKDFSQQGRVAVVTDMAKRNEIERLAEAALALTGVMDIRVNTAGILIAEPIMRKFDLVARMLRESGQSFLCVVTAVLFASAIISAPAFAQGSTLAVESTQVTGQCPGAKEQDPALLNELRELSFKPGVQINPATLMKDPRVAAFIVDTTNREQAWKQTDWSGLCRYREANVSQQAKGATQVVFLGDSITENWIYAAPELFTDKVIDRGIGGQTSSQILLRFYPDVVALRPEVVHIMAGTNDILQDKGPVGDEDIVNNISAMIDIAQVNHIKVVLASILPISVRSWQPDLRPAQRLIHLNERLSALATARGVQFIDYFAVLKDSADGLNADLGNDGVHPNRAGYALMQPMAMRAIEQALH